MTATPNGEPKAPENNSPFEETSTQTSTAPVETPPEQSEEQLTSEQPKSNAPKEAWVAFAEGQGIDTEGLTVAQIKEKVTTPSGVETSEEKIGEPLADVHHDSLPLSAVVGDVFAIVKTNPAGITVLELSMNGFIGVEPVAVPVAQSSDIEKVIAELRTQAAAL